MFKFIGNKKILVLLLSLIVFVALMGFTLAKREKLSWPEKFIKDTVTWTQSLFYRPAGAVAGFFGDIRDMSILYEENKALKMTLSSYARDTMRLNELEAQNKSLKELLNFTERQKNADNYKYHVAEVISMSPDPFTNTVNINLGGRDGLKENMAVISVKGLIGRIDKVSEFTSTVQLLTEIDDTNNTSKAIAATVKDKENQSFGIIQNYDREQKKLIMTNIETTDPLQVGDTVITSGMGLVFPKGIEIGKVVAKEVGEFGINYKATIEPSATFRHLSEVLVVEVPGVG
ncbi:cell shape-determining protein MreC [Paenibacillus sp. J31TS4]|uniref:rod shape-determining protein MreC n=1 Tax=Paenibacillus sp. J31TS4 TaxID=2807195 RepID=UPI001B2505C2|nr:rod shape-determining protein MreC [Paenibacillus sp. J31TS4]GIP39198.1 cell shape-determining protein MreC [Paenibacillus sp. J31TS4]